MVFILPLLKNAILWNDNSETIHKVIFEHSNAFFTIFTDENAKPIIFALPPRTLIRVLTIWETLCTKAILQALWEGAYIQLTIRPSFYALAIIFPLKEFTCVVLAVD